MKNVVIQGMGYVGCGTAIGLASKIDTNKKPIFNVIGIDQSNKNGLKRVRSINKGNFPFIFHDTSITNLLKRCLKQKNLKATTSKKIYSNADVILVSINCDLIKRKGKWDIDLEKYCKSLAEIFFEIKENTLIILQTTVPPGTTKELIYPLLKKILKKRNLNSNKIYLAHSYERVTPGNKYIDTIINYWKVYAGINSESAKKCKLFFEKFIDTKKFPISELNNTTDSEVSKLLENSYRAVNIAFIEEWSSFCENIEVDLFKVINAIKYRPTHSNLMYPGFGVGGYCLTKDPMFAKIGSKKIFNIKNQLFKFSDLALQVNEKMPLAAFSNIKKIFSNNLKDKKILLMGISYKENVDDTRFSPTEIFYDKAKKAGAKIYLNDPMVKYWYEKKIKISNKLINLKKLM